jgi:sulfate adenylyltransferase
VPATPQHAPTARELDDLELLITGALPGSRFNAPGSPVTLLLPEATAEAATAAGAVELVDPEGLPLATVAWPAGDVTPLARPAYGPFRRLHLSPGEVRERYVDRPVVPVTGPLTYLELDALSGRHAVLLALIGTGTPELSTVATVRATLLAATHIGDADVVAVPLASHGDPAVDAELQVQVVAAYGAPATYEQGVDDLPEEQAQYPADIAEVIAFDQPMPSEQGLVLFFTGLSGSGKSTLARALMDKLLEAGRRTVTSLDGDVVRRNLSAGLTFSKQDRETNIRRIGWVAAEIARHRGVAVCSPIAPFDATRQDVRRYVEEAGGAFFLVHVATPLEECERRDRKGLYAKARAGEIPEFTGISSPYEVPEDADVSVDTTGRTIEDALDDVLLALRQKGYVDLAPSVEPGRAATRVETDTPGDSVGFDTGAERPAQPAGSVGFDTGAERPAQPADPSSAPINVLFVCTANICRSAYMRVTSEARGLAGLAFESAGTHGFVDHPMDDEMAKALPDTIDATAFRSKPLTRELLAQADLVLTAESAHRSYILDDHPAMFRKVFTLGQAAETIGKLGDVHGRELLASLASHRGTADTALDVRDPYRRGPEAAAACAAAISRLLDIVLPALAPAGAAR